MEELIRRNWVVSQVESTSDRIVYINPANISEVYVDNASFLRTQRL